MIARFIISGPSVQGIQLRETIYKKARKNELQGRSKNLTDGTVKVLFVYKDKDNETKKKIIECLKDSIKAVMKSGLIDEWDAKNILINEKTADKITIDDDSYDDKNTENRINSNKFFTITREHEQQEIVWALQGAGKVFFLASQKIENVLIYKKMEVVGRLESVKKELLHVQSNLRNVDELVCVKQFISDPLIAIDKEKGETNKLVEHLIEFYHQFEHYRKNKVKTENEDIRFITMIETIEKEIDRTISNIKNNDKL